MRNLKVYKKIRGLKEKDESEANEKNVGECE